MNIANKLLEVKLLVDKNIIEETLSRIGIVDKQKNIIYQSCHLLKQFDTYYIAHFKQLFVLSTGKNGYPGFGNVSIEDLQRRNSIIYKLIQWGMISIENMEDIEPHNTKIEIVKYADKKNYRLVKKFNVKNLNTDLVQ